MIYFLIKKILLTPKYQTISFDIFDTLVERKQTSPLDVFLEVGEEVLGANNAREFCIDRIEAEKVSRSRRESGETTLAEIYGCLKSKYKENINALMSSEVSNEIDSCRRRENVYQLFKEAKNKGRRVIIVSDMYLSRNVIETILNKCGYNAYDAMFISNEEDASKRKGNLYDLVVRNEQVDANTILHIGDSLKADFLSARKHGIAAVLIPRKSAIRRKIHEKSFRGKR